MAFNNEIMVASGGDEQHPGEPTIENIPSSGGGEGHVYDLEMDSTNESVTLTEDGTDKTELPLVPIFTRTREEWDQMTVAEKTQYRLAIFSDDNEYGNISNANITFTSDDTTDANATSWTSVTKLTSGLALKELFARVSQMFKNVRYLYKILGATDISSIGDGTVTGVLSTLESLLNNIGTTYVTTTKASNSAQSSTFNFDAASLSLPTGTYVISCAGRFSDGGSAGNRAFLSFCGVQYAISQKTELPAYGFNMSTIATFNETTTVKARFTFENGVSANIIGSIRFAAVRIK